MRKLNVLFATENPPYPPIAGSSQRTALLIEALSSIANVSLFLIGPPDRKTFMEKHGYTVEKISQPNAITGNFIGRALTFIIPKYSEQIWKTFAGIKFKYTPDDNISSDFHNVISRGNYDLVVGRYLSPSAQIGLFEVDSLPVVIDIDDVDSHALKTKINSPATNMWLKWIFKYRNLFISDIESKLWKKATKLWFSNPEDLSLATGIDADVVPNIPYKIPKSDTLSPSSKNSNIILWVGSFNHHVNRLGVDYFLETTWDKVIKRCPNAIFRIVGSHLPEKERKKWEKMPNVEVVGFVESLEKQYAEAAFSIVPLLDGAGTKIKILESLANMRTCVVTKHAIAGYQLLEDNNCVLVSNNLDDMPEQIFELLSNYEKRTQMEKTGLEIIKNKFTIDAVKEYVSKSLYSLFPDRNKQ